MVGGFAEHSQILHVVKLLLTFFQRPAQAVQVAQLALLAINVLEHFALLGHLSQSNQFVGGIVLDESFIVAASVLAVAVDGQAAREALGVKGSFGKFAGSVRNLLVTDDGRVGGHVSLSGHCGGD